MEVYGCSLTCLAGCSYVKLVEDCLIQISRVLCSGGWVGHGDLDTQNMIGEASSEEREGWSHN